MEKEVKKYAMGLVLDDDTVDKLSKTGDTTDYPVPDSAVIPQPGDKIMAYMKSQFAAQVPYYGMGIRSVNTDLPMYKHAQEF